MADGVTVRTNLPDFRRQMKAVGEEMETKIARAANAKGAKEFAKAARINVFPHSKTGVLQAAIITGRSKFNRQRGVVAHYVSVKHGKKSRTTKTRVGVANRDAYYWRWVEGGHRIVPRGKSLSRGGERSRAVLRARFAGGNTKSVLYLDRAFRSMGGQVLALITREIAKGLDRVNRTK